MACHDDAAQTEVLFREELQAGLFGRGTAGDCTPTHAVLRNGVCRRRRGRRKVPSRATGKSCATFISCRTCWSTPAVDTSESICSGGNPTPPSPFAPPASTACCVAMRTWLLARAAEKARHPVLPGDALDHPPGTGRAGSPWTAVDAVVRHDPARDHAGHPRTARKRPDMRHWYSPWIPTSSGTGNGIAAATVPRRN